MRGRPLRRLPPVRAMIQVGRLPVAPVREVVLRTPGRSDARPLTTIFTAYRSPVVPVAPASRRLGHERDAELLLSYAGLTHEMDRHGGSASDERRPGGGHTHKAPRRSGGP
ncbi:hypothetical protein [Streptomyces sp. FL07-04A]|uniref:hypothetical protein n=1 Tax=Streptomyces sp. FL07-04A TaxID=3028658 RepID=UPI0029BC6EDE|nr:hypothetical protein [Streptomyces sp. FL07-04A]MDX3579728.1 hypothetical protein [Streptomyces sp. FL07-04A]